MWEAIVAEAPCTWDVPEGLLCPDWTNYTAEVKAYALRFATYVVWAATGRRFGLCPVTVRPCKPTQEPLYLTYPVLPSWALWATGQSSVADVVAPVGCCTGACSCGVQALRLPGPVGAVAAVVIDGQALDPSAYRLVQDQLIRQDGGAWPTTQNLSAPAGDPDTWSVSFTRGEAVPPAVLDAAAMYACEVGRSRTGGKCFLPQRVQSVTRQGTEITFVDQADYLNEGLTGVPDVDQIIRTVNPYKLKARPRVLSPDLPRYL
jgi:hypothetical protein